MSYCRNFNGKLLNFWKIFPPYLRYPLLVGSVGSNNMLRLFLKIVNTVSKPDPFFADFLSNLAKNLILVAFDADPLNLNIVKIFHSASSIDNILSPARKHLIKNINKFWDTPVPLKTHKSEAMENLFPDFSSVHKPFSLSWWKDLRIFVSMLQLWKPFDNFLESVRFPEPLEGLRLRLMLDSAIFRRDITKARSVTLALSRGGVLSKRGERFILGNLALLEGNLKETLHHWSHCIDIHPWDVNLILKIYDIFSGSHIYNVLPKGLISICLYSYNKQEALDKTLESIAKSEIGNARIFVLLNGCTDGSYEVVKGWQDKFGKDRFSIISLPVNIGAPAARNWLMHHPEVKKADWIAYLDDDAIVPPDWLRRLGAAVELYPNGGAYGCKVVDSETPYLIQSADYHLLKLDYPDDGKNIPPYRWSTLHYEVEDFGEFDYIRPCVHVTGCCHLFPRDVLLQCGDFDLRYSPSQFDDLDHDFRMALMKRPAIYNGFLTVYHMNNTAKLHRKNPDEKRGGDANWYKLMNKFAGKPFQEIYRWEKNLLWEDFLRKLRVVQEIVRNEIGK